MNFNPLPNSDLRRLHREVLSGSPDSALPCNLPDCWLEMIARDLDFSLEEAEHSAPPSISYASAPLALILHILFEKSGKNEVSIPLDVLHRYFEDLRIEVNLEIMNRRTPTKVTSATLDSIFTDRVLAARHESSKSPRSDTPPATDFGAEGSP